jgi:hypothetical protein
MGLYSNPLAYTGYQPQVTGKPFTTNNTVRAATEEEVDEGSKDFCYVSPQTFSNSFVTNLSSPPPIGDVAPNEVNATTLNSTGNVDIGSGVDVTTINIGASASNITRNINIARGNHLGALTSVGVLTGTAPTNDTAFVVNGGDIVSGTHTHNYFPGSIVGGTQTVNFFSFGNISGGTQNFHVFSNSGSTNPGTIRLGTGAGAAHQLRIGGQSAQIGFFNTTPASVQSQGALTNNVTSGGSAGVIADFAGASYVADAATIRNDIYQLALALQGTIAALRNYGLLQ